MCDSCDAVRINGVLCHEKGCPQAWRDDKRACKWCGSSFKPENRAQLFCCEDCSDEFYGHPSEPEYSTHYNIRIDGEAIWLDDDAWQHGELRFFQGSEQCEDCGRDLAESAKLVKRGSMVKCECGAVYVVKRQD